MHHLLFSGRGADHPIARADARLKLVCALTLLAMVISSPGRAFPLLVSLLSLGLCLTLGVGPRTLLIRFSEPLFIAATLLLLKLFFSGSIPLFTLHFAGIELVGYRDGLAQGMLIASRVTGAVSVLAAVGFSTEFTELMAAFSWLRVPQLLIDLSLFAWRYLFLLFEDAQVVYLAQRNRLGYAGWRRGLRSLGTLTGVLVIKAFDNSQQITTAMVQRGYDGELPLLRHKPFVTAELCLSCLFLAGMGLVRSL
jgi:cobalt/nickel transport system permease protein